MIEDNRVPANSDPRMAVLASFAGDHFSISVFDYCAGLRGSSAMKTTSILQISVTLLGLLLTSQCRASAARRSDVAQQPSLSITAKVDERVELMSIIARLAGYPEYGSNVFKSYVSDVAKYFEPYKQHDAVQLAKRVRQRNGVGFDAVMSMAVHLNQPPLLTPRVPFTDQVPEVRWGHKNAEEFAGLLQRFYRDANCEAFFKAHATLYRTAEQRYQAILDKVDPGWYERFYGAAPGASFNLIIGLLNGGGNFGPKVIRPDGKEDLYAIMGTWQMDEQGLPKYDDNDLYTIIHEYNHSFINHLVFANEQQLSKAGEKIYPLVAERMKLLAYGNWQVMISESLVRAAVIRYMMQHGAQQQRQYSAVMRERNIGFVWMDELTPLLGVYENTRRAYPTFQSFFPMIAGYYADLAERIDFKVKKFEEMLPHVASMSPFSERSPGCRSCRHAIDVYV